jgi:hypothetical protein
MWETHSESRIGSAVHELVQYPHESHKHQHHTAYATTFAQMSTCREWRKRIRALIHPPLSCSRGMKKAQRLEKKKGSHTIFYCFSPSLSISRSCSSSSVHPPV